MDEPVTNIVKMDGWFNVLSGLGGKKDKSTYTQHAGYTWLDDETLTSIYIGDGLGGRIVDIVADDMTREWIDFDVENGAVFRDELIRLNAEEAFNIALKWQRLYGGALLIIGALDGNPPEKPLNEKKIKTIQYLKVVDRTCVDMNASEFYTDPADPNFGKVKVFVINYNINGQLIKMKVHSSRCIEFHNDAIPSVALHSVPLSVRYWGMSSLQRIYEEVRDLGGVTQSTLNILFEFIIGKYKFNNLQELIAEGNEKQLVTRMEIMDMSKSILNAVILDNEEDYTRDYANLAGIPEVIDRFMLKLSGSTTIPVTRLFGRSPAGLNATGENDLRNYYDLVESNQRNKLKPTLMRLVGIISNYKKVSPIDIKFNSLYQTTEQEKAAIEKDYALAQQYRVQTAVALVDSGIWDTTQAAKSLQKEFTNIPMEIDNEGDNEPVE